MRFTLLAALVLLPLALAAQRQPVPTDANRFTYWQLGYGDQADTTLVIVDVHRGGKAATVYSPLPSGNLIRGYAQTVTTIDYAADSLTVAVLYPDSHYYYRTAFSRADLAWVRDGQRWRTSINSNTLEFEVDDTSPFDLTPLPHYGHLRGLLRTFVRNGQPRLVLAKAERADSLRAPFEASPKARRVDPRDLDRIMKQRMVIATRVFDHAQLHWGEPNAHIDGGPGQLPADTVLHYAGGTLILKRLTLPTLPSHYQHFAELHQQSHGDAYDRTGSLFVIPCRADSPFGTLFDGINQHPDSLPVFIGRDGQRYQGMMRTDTYEPALEWVRFFTPFGIGHYNSRMQADGLEWRNEAYFRQEITDVYVGGDVVVGAWIGNYDAGGHLLTVDIKSYPNSPLADPDADASSAPQPIPLFNTCNVLEMVGQNYGKLFATDSLTVQFTLPAGTSRARLRYLATGHGGWDEGDEFVPKTHTLLVDGQPAFSHTPWREDCGCYRDLNPVSGNFWNGLSSSDFSRSGWCPGTATQPVYFDLTPWADGQPHTLTVAIPQGQPVNGMFSHWAVSGALLLDR